jgi:hypothetical protein
VLWFAGAALAMVAFAVWERSRTHPMLDLHLFADPRFSVSSAGIMLLFFALFGTLFLATQYLQLVLGYTPFEAGVRILPQFVVMASLSPQTPKLVARFGAHRVGSMGLALVAAGLLLVTQWQADTPYLQVALTLMVIAAGMASTMAPMTAELMSAVPPAKAGVGSAMNDTTRELGGALGVAVLGSIVAGQYASGVADRLAGLPVRVTEVAGRSLSAAVRMSAQSGLDPDMAGLVRRAGQQAFLEGFHVAAVVGAVTLAVASVAVHRLLPALRNDPNVAEHVG